jgi:hypothetical protein
VLLLQTPPEARSVKVTDWPVHTVDGPEIDGNEEITVTVVLRVQPEDGVKVIIEVPAEIPVYTPVAEPIVAMAVEDEDQVPEPSVWLSVLEPDRQTEEIPDMTGIFTVTLP